MITYLLFQYNNNMKAIYYFTTLISLFFLFGCADKTNQNIHNEEASLPDQLKDKVAGLMIINSSINTKKQTTSVLYGNKKAIERIADNDSVMRTGEKLIRITWHQKPDPNWIGAVIPGKLISFETLELLSEKEPILYQKIEGNPMQVKKDTLGNLKSIKYILHQKMAVLP